jgi:peptidoglycan/xylan/chitin deacetylase (PgdA/CDA1 family)
MPVGTFVRQIDWMGRNFPFVSLGEAQRRIASRINREPCVSITFDDGYAANCEHAVPLLLTRRIALTYFVSSDPVLRGRTFEHDLALGAHCPANSLDQLKSMADSGVEIGAHTRSHADMGAVDDAATRHDELVSARDELARSIGVPIRYFAFPFGQHRNLSAEAFRVCRAAGYEAVCSAYGGYNFPGDDPFHLQRFCADDMIRLKNWMSLDRRKIRNTPRYEYAAPGSDSPRAHDVGQASSHVVQACGLLNPPLAH